MTLCQLASTKKVVIVTSLSKRSSDHLYGFSLMLFLNFGIDDGNMRNTWKAGFIWSQTAPSVARGRLFASSVIPAMTMKSLNTASQFCWLVVYILVLRSVFRPSHLPDKSSQQQTRCWTLLSIVGVHQTHPHLLDDHYHDQSVFSSPRKVLAADINETGPLSLDRNQYALPVTFVNQSFFLIQMPHFYTLPR